MIAITAGPPPAAFAFHRANRSSYAELSGEEAIRSHLFAEQRGLCAYCERRLTYVPGGLHKTRIEHFHPQNPLAGDTLVPQACGMASGASPLTDSDTTWANLLLCCDGEEGKGHGFTHCDVSKRDTDICYRFRNPKTFAGSRLLDVHPDGRVVPIAALPEGAEWVVEEVLRLNRRSLTVGLGRRYAALIRGIASEKRRPPFGLTPARRASIRARLRAEVGTTDHPSVLLAVAEQV